MPHPDSFKVPKPPFKTDEKEHVDVDENDNEELFRPMGDFDNDPRLGQAELNDLCRDICLSKKKRSESRPLDSKNLEH